MDQEERERLSSQIKGGLVGYNVNYAVIQYNNTRNGFWFWRAYTELREAGMPIPEHMLKKFDQYASALAALEDAGTSKEAMAAKVRALELDQKKGTIASDETAYRVAHFLSLWPDAPLHELKEQAAKQYGLTVKSVYDIAKKYGLTESKRKPAIDPQVPTTFWANPFGKKPDM